MNLSQLVRQALKQMDEHLADVSEHDDLFRAYANKGYQIVMRERCKPRRTLTLRTDARSQASLAGQGVLKVIEVRDAQGCPVWSAMSGDGQTLVTNRQEQTISALCEMDTPPLIAGTDEPAFPEWAHGMLADYICYRHLANGNMAKQQRAQFYLNAFAQTMRRILPQGSGSVTGLRHLYAASDIRSGRQ